MKSSMIGLASLAGAQPMPTWLGLTPATGRSSASGAVPTFRPE